MDDFVPFNEVYATAFKADFPARSAVEVARLPKDVKWKLKSSLISTRCSIILFDHEKVRYSQRTFFVLFAFTVFCIF